MREEEVARSLAERIERVGTPRSKDELILSGNTIAINGNGNHIHYNTNASEPRSRRPSAWARMFGLLFMLCIAASMALLYQPPDRGNHTLTIRQAEFGLRGVEDQLPLQQLLVAIGASAVVSGALTLATRTIWLRR